MYRKLHFGTCYLLADPILGLLYWPLKGLARTCCPGCRGILRKKEEFNECREKKEQELDIVNILQKLRDSHGMLRYLHDGVDKKLLDFNVDRVITLSETEEHEQDDKDESHLDSDGFEYDRVQQAKNSKLKADLRLLLAKDTCAAIKLSVIRGMALPPASIEVIRDKFIQDSANRVSGYPDFKENVLNTLQSQEFELQEVKEVARSPTFFREGRAGRQGSRSESLF